MQLKNLVKFSNIKKNSFHIPEHTFMVIVAVFIGVLGGFGAIFFRYAIKFFQKLFFGTFHYNLEYVLSLPWYVKLFAPAIGGLIVGPIVYFFAREAKGHGVPEVMESIALKGGTIRPRVMIAKVIASAVCIGSGGSVGREGPIVQIGSALGSTIGQFLKVTGSHLRTFVACGAAAGIAGTFNAPIAGALFSMEVILGDFGISQFSPIVVSSVASTVVSRHFLGNFPAFVVPNYELLSVYEMIPYTILGFLAAFTALLFINVLYRFEDFFEELKFPEMFQPVIGGLFIGLLGIALPHVFGVGYDTISLALTGKLTWYFLLLLIFMKIFATSVTIGSGGSGGVFAPSLFIGANLGGFVGTIFHNIFPNIIASPGAYALVGMGAVAAGAMHAPITSIVIIFELTNNYTIILPLMISCIISVLITSRLQKDSIYTLKLSRRGIDLLKGQEINILKSLQVSKVLSNQFVKVLANTSLKNLIELIVSTPHHNFFVVNSKNEIIGVISIDELRNILNDLDNLEPLLVAYDVMTPLNKFFYSTDTLDIVMKAFEELNIDEVPVVDENNKIIGTVSKNNVINAYNQEVFKRDTLNQFSSYINSLDKFKEVQLMPGQFLAELEVPPKFIGKNIKELNISNKYNVEVVLIKREVDSNYEILIPHDNFIFTSKDFIIVIGNKKNIDKLKGYLF
jgi:CIC family chloride channel protein